MLIERPHLISRECAWSQKINDPTGFIGRGKTLARVFLPGTAARILKADGTIENPSTQVVDADRTQENSSSHLIEKAITNRARVGSQGLLSEEPETNECLRSQELDNAAYTQVDGITFTADSTVAPDGTTTADTLTDGNAAAKSLIRQSFTVASDTLRRIWSAYFLKTTAAASFPGLRAGYTGGNFGAVTINTDTGVLTNRTGETPDTAFIDSEGLYWRVSIGIDNTSQTAWLVEILAAVNTDGSATWTDATTGSTVAWGTQYEVNDYVTSYIPTGASSVAGAADNIQFDNTGEVLAKKEQGSVLASGVAEFDPADTVGFRTMIDIVTAVPFDGVRMFGDSADAYFVQIFSGGSGVNLQATSIHTRKARQLMGLTWKANDFRLSVDGVEEDTDATLAAPAAMPTEMFMGISRFLGDQHSGHLSAVLSTSTFLNISQIQHYNSLTRRWTP